MHSISLVGGSNKRILILLIRSRGADHQELSRSHVGGVFKPVAPTDASPFTTLLPERGTVSHTASRTASANGSAGLANPRLSLLCIVGLWIVLFFASLASPPLLDDADATHANAARAMLATGDWVTLHVNGIRYLEKAPLPYWLDAISFHIFGANAFAAHLPQALGVLALALLAWHWSRRVFSARAGLYAGVFVLTSAGVFLFTRVFIPEAILSFFLAIALYCFERAMETTATIRHDRPKYPAAFYAYTMWAAIALGVLTKGLIAIVFPAAAILLFLAIAGEWRHWRVLRPFTGTLLLLAIAAPWHILAGLRNTGGMNGHGFFWFYFVNEHILRFLGRRYPKDYNKLPGYLYWSLHLVWLFPWSLFAPLAFLRGGVRRSPQTPAQRTTLLLLLFAGFLLVFFSLSTNQEYYTFPAYLPMLMLLAAGLFYAEESYAADATSRRWLNLAHAAYTVLGIAIACALGYGLWSARGLPFEPDIGDMLAHRNVGHYTLSMSHFFDLTGPSFAALRLPATLALLAFATGPALAWLLRVRRRHLAATMTVAATSAVFLIAAHIALIRFAPMLSSANIAQRIQQLEDSGAISRNNEVLLYGDQAYGSSIPFYLRRTVLLVDGRSTSMLFGSTFPDAPHIFLTNADLVHTWGTGERKLLFVPLEKHAIVTHLLGNRAILLVETSGKALYTDRPLDRAGRTAPTPAARSAISSTTEPLP
jgi:4-amino-4-deoxy-L-arabinose transferase-like glycosyltransferase